MKIRFAQVADVPQIVGIFFNTIHKVNIRDYTEAQVQAWAPALPDPQRWVASKFHNRVTFVAEQAGQIVGFGELEPAGHIDCFYCHHAFQRQGIGAALYGAIEQESSARCLARLVTEASITARAFFAAQGFELIRQQIVIRRGVELTNFAMEKRLGRSKTDGITKFGEERSHR